MNVIAKSACWAAAILLVAAGNALGLVADKAADVLLIVLPIVAVMAIRGRSSCAFPRREAM